MGTYPVAAVRGKNFLAPSAFSPLSLSPVVWLKADALVLSNNDPVGTWADSSGNGNDATGVTTTRPLYKTNIQNSLPAVLFDGSDDYMSLPDLSASFPTAATLYVVYNQTDAAASYTVFTNTNTDEYWRFSVDGDGYMGTFRGSRASNYPPAMPDSGATVFSLVSSASEYSAYVNAVLKAGGSASYSAGGNYYQLGRGVVTGVPSLVVLKGYIFELLLFAGAHSAGNMALMHTYLNSRWAVY